MKVEIQSGALRVTVRRNDTTTDTHGDTLFYHGPEATFVRRLSKDELTRVTELLDAENFALTEMVAKDIGEMRKEMATRRT